LVRFLPRTKQAILEPISFADIASWNEDDHRDAMEAFRRSAIEITDEGRSFGRDVHFGGQREDWLGVCGRAREARDAKRFFEMEFAPFLVHDPLRPEGLFTGYYEPLAEGSLTPSADYPVPIYRKPPDLVAFDTATEHSLGLKYGRMRNGKPEPYPSRQEIEQGALNHKGLELVWLKSWADAFFIHVQGSGRVSLPDGNFMRLAYAGKSGRAYTGIGGVLVEKGLLAPQDMSMQSLRRWMAANAKQARELMWLNDSFIFFREVAVADQSLGAPGAQKVPLHPKRSLAVDRGIWAFGTPVWLDMETPSGPGAGLETFRRLMIAQDTGTAIKGYARGDVYWGWGEAAALAAGHMKSPGRMIVLLPRALKVEGLR
jgi:membrane-bound lytic murein transglycosylase A